jgi:hypothetical protein|tara:strand:+ start:1911 stop:2399 length:489 start_codon:yes stop_codon:yes gene_type:complete
MTAPSGFLSGHNSGLYTNATAITTFDSAAAEAFAIAGNFVDGVTEFSALSNEDSIQDLSIIGRPVVSHVLGQGTAQEFTFSLAMNMADATSVALRDDARTTDRGFVVAFDTTTGNTPGTTATFCMFNGMVVNTSITGGSADGIATLEVTVRRSGDLVWVDLA